MRNQKSHRLFYIQKFEKIYKEELQMKENEIKVLEMDISKKL